MPARAEKEKEEEEEERGAGVESAVGEEEAEGIVKLGEKREVEKIGHAHGHTRTLARAYAHTATYTHTHLQRLCRSASLGTASPCVPHACMRI